MPADFRNIDIPPGVRVLVLAPHPDDFDAISITLGHLHRHGALIKLAVLTGGASGVEDSFAGTSDAAAKAALREEEQRGSCAFFGLPHGAVQFLKLIEDDAGHPEVNADNVAAIAECLAGHSAQWVFLPHGNDSNTTHRRTYALFRAVAAEKRLQVRAFLNQDAKTQGMRHDLFMPFDETDAAWKAELLRFHRSQQQRNLNTRGMGFDERVLHVNRTTAAALQLAAPCAEAFEVENFS